MLDTDPTATFTVRGAQDEGSTFAHNARYGPPTRLRRRGDEADDIAARRVEYLVSTLSRAMGPVGLVGCLGVMGWMMMDIL